MKAKLKKVKSAKKKQPKITLASLKKDILSLHESLQFWAKQIPNRNVVDNIQNRIGMLEAKVFLSIPGSPGTTEKMGPWAEQHGPVRILYHNPKFDKKEER